MICARSILRLVGSDWTLLPPDRREHSLSVPRMRRLSSSSVATHAVFSFARILTSSRSACVKCLRCGIVSEEISQGSSSMSVRMTFALARLAGRIRAVARISWGDVCEDELAPGKATLWDSGDEDALEHGEVPSARYASERESA